LSAIADYRLEFNPATAGRTGFDTVVNVLDELTNGLAMQMFRGGTITRVDVALDLAGLSVNDVLIWIKRQRKNGIFTDQFGYPQTLYLGGARSGQTVAYNKLDKATGEPFFRVERRIRPRCVAQDLVSLPNPFTKVAMVHVDSVVPLIETSHPEWFLDSVRVRGFSRAIRAMPRGQQKAIKQLLNDPSRSLLPTDQDIWQQWPATIIQAGFTSPTADVSAEAPLVLEGVEGKTGVKLS
jgi:hypothetical protein